MKKTLFLLISGGAFSIAQAASVFVDVYRDGPDVYKRQVVVDAEGKELGRTGYIPGQTPVQYVEFFKKYAPKTAEAK